MVHRKMKRVIPQTNNRCGQDLLSPKPVHMSNLAFFKTQVVVLENSWNKKTSQNNFTVQETEENQIY